MKDEILIVGAYYFFGVILIAFFSRRSLMHCASHGFYRFFVLVGIFTLDVMRSKAFRIDLIEMPVFLPTFLLIPSAALAIAGSFELWRNGKSNDSRSDESLFAFEKTTELVTSGIYRIIRHPMYLSLALLAWGIFFIQPTALSLPVVAITSYFLLLTMRADEAECTQYFGDRYLVYQQKTWALIPLVY